MTFLYENNAAGTLSAPITAGSAALTLNPGQASLFPNPTAPDTFFATLTDAATETLIEIVSVTAVSGNVMSITRAQDGTSAQSWNTGDILSQRVVAAELRQWQGIGPVGGIILWSGSASAIPENWTLCNGTAGTPNLENNFVIGAGGTFAVGATGGASTAALTIPNMPAHTHTATVTDPGHFHSVALGQNILGLANGAAAIDTSTNGPVNTDTRQTGITISNSSTGSGTAFSILPPYYALCYIMRVT